MEQRRLGRTGLMVPVLGYGCGVVGGLMVRGAPADRERSVARAIEAGVNYFDTAAAYGNGESERNLGQVLKALGGGARDVLVGTKVRIAPEQRARLGATVTASLEDS
ncbi:MAG: aldo/keto reductase, partial [Acetobacteraceae bacterium]|nr:aldo/keto reductase [Acetobacteraceae bacterium]